MKKTLATYIKNCYHKNYKTDPDTILVALIQWYMTYKQEWVDYNDVDKESMRDILWGYTSTTKKADAACVITDERVADKDNPDYDVTLLRLNDRGIRILREEGLLK